MSTQNNKGLRDPIWQFIWGAVSTILAMITIIVGILALPQAGPARNIISRTFAEATPTPTSSPSATATSTPTSTNYSAIQPGSGCDTKRGGVWTSSQEVSGITCDSGGTQLAVNSPNSRGYLYLQLPNKEAFSSNNTISVIGTLQGFLGAVENCVGLAEQDVNTGFLGEYCQNGGWFIYSISSGGAILRQLDKGVTATKANTEILLTLQGTTLSFSVDNVALDNITILPIHPTKVAITYLTGPYSNGSVSITNFSYTVPSS